MATPISYAQDLPQELLSHIFSYLDRMSNTQNARVCKAWTNGALDETWRNLYDWTKALASVAGTVMDPTTRKMKLSSPLTKSIWDRFIINSHRVRRICGEGNPGVRWSDEALIEIMSTRPLSALFPNLYILEISEGSKPQFGPIVMHHSITTLSIRGSISNNPPTSSMNFTALSRHALERMPNLTTLHIDIATDDPIEKDLCALIQGLPHLRDITLSPSLFYPSIINPLATRDSLRALSSLPYFIEWVKAPSNFRASLQPGAFPALQSIEFGCSLAHALKFFVTPHFPTPTLTTISLHITPPHHQIALHLQGLLSSLADLCCSLERLDLHMAEVDYPGMPMQEPESSPALTFADIRSVLRLSNLRTFTIRYIYPVEITDHEIEIFAASLPHLEELFLNAYPMFTPEPTLTLRAIISFAVHCPNLRQLALYLSTIAVDLSPSTNARFNHLAQFCIGYSTVSGATKYVSQFLFPILPGSCKTLASVSEESGEYDYVADPELWETESSDKRENAIEFWEEVQNLLTLMNQVKDDAERAVKWRLEAVERELKVAKSRLELFELHA